MTSEAKRASNQANAQKSTGPKTAAGKQAAARNATRHGLSRGRLPAEALAEARSLAEALQTEHPFAAPWTTARLAEAMVLQSRLQHVAERHLEEAIETIEPSLPHAEREARARLQILPTLKALAGYELRAARTVRKQLRKLLQETETT